MNKINHKFIKICVGMLIFNLLLILVICIIRKDLNLVTYFYYMFYVGLINVILGFLVKLGNRETKAANEMLNYFLTYRKTSEELFNENIKDTNKGTCCMITFEVMGILFVVTSNVMSKII